MQQNFALDHLGEKTASLKLGPSLANLDGARLGAERIGWFMQDRLATGMLEWSHKKNCMHFVGESIFEDGQKTLDTKLEGDFDGSSFNVSDTELSGYETRLKLASGQMN